jgi:hypothetical protein
MAKIDFQVNDAEADSGDGNGQAHRSEDAKLQRLGVNQQLKVCASIDNVDLDHYRQRLMFAAEAIWPIILDRFYHGDDVYLGICHSVRALWCHLDVMGMDIDSQSRFFVTAFVNGGGPAMISGFIVAFFGALATCASYVSRNYLSSKMKLTFVQHGRDGIHVSCLRRTIPLGRPSGAKRQSQVS